MVSGSSAHPENYETIQLARNLARSDPQHHPGRGDRGAEGAISLLVGAKGSIAAAMVLDFAISVRLPVSEGEVLQGRHTQRCHGAAERGRGDLQTSASAPSVIQHLDLERACGFPNVHFPTSRVNVAHWLNKGFL